MNEVVNHIGTITLTGKVYTFLGTNGITSASLKLISGTVTYQGTSFIITDDGIQINSSAETLDDSGFEIVAPNPIDGFVVDATGGSCILAFIH